MMKSKKQQKNGLRRLVLALILITSFAFLLLPFVSAQQVVYATSTTPDLSHFIKIDGATGEVIWNRSLSSSRFATTPAVTPYGVVYQGRTVSSASSSTLLTITPNSNVYGLSSCCGTVASIAVVGNDVYALHSLSAHRKVVKTNTQTGFVWETPNQGINVNEVAADENTVWLAVGGSSDGEIRGFDAVTGNSLWNTSIDVRVNSMVVDNKGNAYFSGSVGNGQVTKIDSSGNIIWSRTESNIFRAARYDPRLDRVIVHRANNALFSINASNGATIWSTSISGNSATIGVDGESNIYFLQSGDLTKFDSDGNELYSVSTDFDFQRAVALTIPPPSNTWSGANAQGFATTTTSSGSLQSASYQGTYTIGSPNIYFTSGDSSGSSQISLYSRIPPVAQNVTLTPVPARTLDNITLNYDYFSSEGAVESGTTFRWYINNNLLSGVNTQTLPYTHTQKGDVVVGEVTPKEALISGAPTNSTPITIANTAPTAFNLTITPEDVEDNQDATGSYEYFDIDGDLESGTIERWRVNGVVVVSGSNTISQSYYGGGDNLTYEVLASDGEDLGTPVSISVEVQNSRDAPTIGTREIRLMNNQTVDNTVELTPLVDYRWYTADYTHNNLSEENATLTLWYVTLGNGNVTLLEELWDVTNKTFQYSTPFQLPDYEPWTYNITITDQFNTSSSYTGTIQALNQQPVITNVQTFRQGVANSCQSGSQCQLRITMFEDACGLSSQEERVTVVNNLNDTLINTTSLILVSQNSGVCVFRTQNFVTPNSGVHEYEVSFTDFGGLSDSVSGTFGTVVATQPAPPPLSQPGGPVGSVVEEVIIIRSGLNESFKVIPDTAFVEITQTGRYRGEFQVVNDGLLDVTVGIGVNQAMTDPEVADWLTFTGRTTVTNLVVPPGQGLSSNTRFVRYQLEPTRVVPPGDYTIVLDIMSGDMVEPHTITVRVRESRFAEFEAFWNNEITTFGVVCGETPLLSASEQVVETSEEVYITCNPFFILRNKHVIVASLLLMGGAWLTIVARNRRISRRKARGGRD